MNVGTAAVTFGPLILLGVCLMTCVVFGRDGEVGDVVKRPNGEPLAIEAEARPCPNPVHQPTPEPRREVIHAWDSVDQHWGETQWMMAVG